MDKKSLLFILVDGLGVGMRRPESNPLAAIEPRVLRFFKDSFGPFPIRCKGLCTDAGLGVPGLPQSATGQVSLLTGINAAALLGRHAPGFPNGRLREVLASDSIFKRLQERGLSVGFANTYTPRFFTHRPRWISASTAMCESSGVPFRTLEDLEAGRALYMDFSNRLLRAQGFEVPEKTPEAAAAILCHTALELDFCFYEYFLTDVIGHRGSWEEAVFLLEELDRFLAETIRLALNQNLSVLLTSDHGNIEDMSRKQHTQNPVATLLCGAVSEATPQNAFGFSLTDVVPLIERHYTTLESGP